jgi:hypothetical protein
MRTPVFIVGAPRSGTTLLRVTLSRHSQLAICPESAFFPLVYARRYAFGDPANLRHRTRIVDAYLAIEQVGKLGMDREVLRERLMREGVSWRALFASLLQTCADTHGKPYFGEKTPRHARYVNTLCEWFPDSTIIHLVRDPRAAVCSRVRTRWSNRSVLMGARMWRVLNAAASAVSGRDNYLLVKYEDLVTQTEDQLRRICSHIGLEYEQAMLGPVRAEGDPRQPSHPAYQRISPARVESWHAELEPWQVAAIEAAAGRRMEQFGYRHHTTSSPASLARAAADALLETAMQKFCQSPSFFYHFLQPTNLLDEEKWLERGAVLYERLRPRRLTGVRHLSGPGTGD